MSDQFLPYVKIPSYLVRDKSLSDESFRVIAYLHSQSSTFRPTVAKIRADLNISDHRWRKVSKELNARKIIASTKNIGGTRRLKYYDVFENVESGNHLKDTKSASQHVDLQRLETDPESAENDQKYTNRGLHKGGLQRMESDRISTSTSYHSGDLNTPPRMVVEEVQITEEEKKEANRLFLTELMASNKQAAKNRNCK